MKIDNPSRKISKLWGILSPVFLLLTFFSFNADIGDAAFALAFLFFILFITAIIVAVIYGKQASKLDRIIAGEGLLAHWTYTTDEWQRYAEKNYQVEKSGRKKLFFIVAGFALLIGIIYLIINREAGLGVFLMMLIVIAVTGFSAWFASWRNYRQNKNTGDAYISKDGIYLNKQIHIWNQLGARLSSMKYIEETPPMLVFSYVALTGTISQEYTVRVPVPSGQETRAKEILEQLQSITGK